MTEEDKEPVHWADLTVRERKAILSSARSRIFWEDFWSRMTWLKGAGTVFLTLAAAWTLLGEGLAKWLGAK